jgi:hypothetical protein
MKSYNEADVIGPSLHRLINNGIKVYLIDNWSTDGTVEIARKFLGNGLLSIEQYPPEGRLYHHWAALLRRTEEVALMLNANWYIHHDIDEFRETPWPELNLRDGFYHADQCGFNAVDFTLVNFEITDDSFIAGSDFVEHFHYWDFGHRPGHFQQIKAWKHTGQRVNLVDTGGHHANFPEQRVYAYKFLTRHYTFRTQEQAFRKIFEDRTIHPDAQGKMHGHLDLYRELYNEKQSFLRNPEDLKRFDESFYSNFLVERVSGINIPRKWSV